MLHFTPFSPAFLLEQLLDEHDSRQDQDLAISVPNLRTAIMEAIGELQLEVREIGKLKKGGRYTLYHHPLSSSPILHLFHVA